MSETVFTPTQREIVIRFIIRSLLKEPMLAATFAVYYMSGIKSPIRGNLLNHSDRDLLFWLSGSQFDETPLPEACQQALDQIMAKPATGPKMGRQITEIMQDLTDGIRTTELEQENNHE